DREPTIRPLLEDGSNREGELGRRVTVDVGRKEAQFRRLHGTLPKSRGRDGRHVEVSLRGDRADDGIYHSTGQHALGDVLGTPVFVALKGGYRRRSELWTASLVADESQPDVGRIIARR